MSEKIILYEENFENYDSRASNLKWSNSFDQSYKQDYPTQKTYGYAGEYAYSKTGSLYTSANNSSYRISSYSYAAGADSNFFYGKRSRSASSDAVTESPYIDVNKGDKVDINIAISNQYESVYYSSAHSDSSLLISLVDENNVEKQILIKDDLSYSPNSWKSISKSVDISGKYKIRVLAHTDAYEFGQYVGGAEAGITAYIDDIKIYRQSGPTPISIPITTPISIPISIPVAKPIPTYTLTSSATTINEGAILTTSVATTNVASGTILYYTLSGTGINVADFSTGALTGSGTVASDGNFSFDHNLANDLAIEGPEWLEVKLFTDSERTAQAGSTSLVFIYDTSTGQLNSSKKATIQFTNSEDLDLVDLDLDDWSWRYRRNDGTEINANNFSGSTNKIVETQEIFNSIDVFGSDYGDRFAFYQDKWSTSAPDRDKPLKVFYKGGKGNDNLFIHGISPLGGQGHYEISGGDGWDTLWVDTEAEFGIPEFIVAGSKTAISFEVYPYGDKNSISIFDSIEVIQLRIWEKDYSSKTSYYLTSDLTKGQVKSHVSPPTPSTPPLNSEIHLKVNDLVKAGDIVSQWFGTAPPATQQIQDISDTKLMDLVATTWADKVKINRVAKATNAGGRIEAKQINLGSGEVAGSVIAGGKGNDDIKGYAGWDIIDGGAGDDLIHGGNGRDILAGGTGRDELHGDFGWNTYRSEKDGVSDLIAIKSDQFLVNWLYGKAGNSPNGEKSDIIESLDPIDKIKIIGVDTSEITFAANVITKGVTGIGIYGKGILEALYTGGDLSVAQITQMTSGDASAAAMSNSINAYGVW